MGARKQEEQHSGAAFCFYSFFLFRLPRTSVRIYSNTSPRLAIASRSPTPLHARLQQPVADVSFSSRLPPHVVLILPHPPADNPPHQAPAAASRTPRGMLYLSPPAAPKHPPSLLTQPNPPFTWIETAPHRFTQPPRKAAIACPPSEADLSRDYSRPPPDGGCQPAAPIKHPRGANHRAGSCSTLPLPRGFLEEGVGYLRLPFQYSGIDDEVLLCVQSFAISPPSRPGGGLHSCFCCELVCEMPEHVTAVHSGS